MLVIGLTGGVGSGKSTVADLFAEKGIPIIDTDIIAREIVIPGEKAYADIVTHFGPQILHNDHTLNRTRLRQLIFENAQERKWLENLLHPIIREKVAQRILTLNAPYCIVVIPLLAESQAYPLLNRVLVIDTAKELQQTRLRERDNVPLELVNAMIAAQASRAERLAIADDIIVNNGSIDELRTEVLALHQQYLTI